MTQPFGRTCTQTRIPHSATSKVPLFLLGLLEKGRKLAEGVARNRLLLPQVGREVRVGEAQGSVGGLDEVSHGCSLTASRGKTILNSSEGQQALGGSGGNQTGSARGRNQSDRDRAALGSDLGGHGVDGSDTVSPVTSANGHDGNLGGNDGTANGIRNFLGTLNSETNVSVVVSDNDKRLEAGALTSASLLLNGHDLGNLVLQLRQKGLDNLVLLDGQRKQVHSLERLDQARLDETAQLGDGHPAANIVILLGSTSLI